MHGKSKVFHREPDWQNVFPRLWFPARQRSRGDHTETGDSVDSSDAPVIRSRLNQLELLTGIRMMIRILLYEDHLIESSDAPVIRSGLNQLELLTGIRMMIRILSYEDNYWQQWFSSHPICARPSRTVVKILSHCNIEDHPICKKWSTPNHPEADKIFNHRL